MFFALTNLFPADQPHRVFRIHPVQLSRWLDEVWAGARRLPPAPAPAPSWNLLNGSEGLGDADLLHFVDPQVIDAVDLPTQPPGGYLAPSGINQGAGAEWSGEPAGSDVNCPPRLWHHLIYAYLIESTGIVEVFTEVMRRFVVGETLAVLSPESRSWARATEQMFFRDPPPFSIIGVVSQLRPHERTNRRNAYWRMFGMDLPHLIPPHWSAPEPFADWKAQTGNGVNADFRQNWNELLRQVWLGVENRSNTSGPNPADPSYIALLCRALKDMMANRRRGGALALEEFAYVTMASWFHLTIDSDTPVVRDLQAHSSNPAGRLAAIAQRVGMSPATRSRELFELAEPMSHVLRAIELGLFDTADEAALFYTSGSTIVDDMLTVINNWQSATGERVKERPIGTVVTGSAQPLRVPVPGGPLSAAPGSATVGAAPVGATAGNGRGR